LSASFSLYGAFGWRESASHFFLAMLIESIRKRLSGWRGGFTTSIGIKFVQLRLCLQVWRKREGRDLEGEKKGTSGRNCIGGTQKLFGRRVFRGGLSSWHTTVIV